jgi:hypothetical protein
LSYSIFMLFKYIKTLLPPIFCYKKTPWSCSIQIEGILTARGSSKKTCCDHS